MANPTLKTGEIFFSQDGSGIVLPSGQALLIYTNGDARSLGLGIMKTDVPGDARPDHEPVDSYTRFALQAVAVAIS